MQADGGSSCKEMCMCTVSSVYMMYAIIVMVRCSNPAPR